MRDLVLVSVIVRVAAHGRVIVPALVLVNVYALVRVRVPRCSARF